MNYLVLVCEILAMYASYCTLLIFFFIPTIKSWSLSHLGLTKYSVKHISTFRNHAYLSINGFKNNKTFSYIIDAPWPEDPSYFAKARIFPSPKFYSRKDCDHLQSVISTDVDSFGRIWILDEGDDKFNCSAKLVVYNLYTDQIVHRHIFDSAELKFSNIVVDKAPFYLNQMAYIGVSNKNVMFICPFKSMTCNMYIINKISIKAFEDSSITTEEFAVSGFDDLMFVTSKETFGIFVINLEPIRRQPLFKENDAVSLNAYYLGDKLGRSQGLIADLQDRVCYYLVRDYAVVCWDLKKPLTAEGHSVLMQSYLKLPNVTQLFLDSQYNIWAHVDVEKFSKTKKKHNNKKLRINKKSKDNVHIECVNISETQ